MSTTQHIKEYLEYKLKHYTHHSLSSELNDFICNIKNDDDAREQLIEEITKRKRECFSGILS